VNRTQPIAKKKSPSTFPDGDEIVIFDANSVLPQVTLDAQTPCLMYSSHQALQFVVELSPAGSAGEPNDGSTGSDKDCAHAVGFFYLFIKVDLGPANK
jgi:hypothetical protein